MMERVQLLLSMLGSLRRVLSSRFSRGSCILTALSHLADVHALLCSHEAQHREHHKACKETGPAVNESQQECIPTEKYTEKERKRRGGDRTERMIL